MTVRQMSRGQWIVLIVVGLGVLAAVSLLAADAIRHTLRSAGKPVARTAGQVAFINVTYHSNHLGTGDVYLLDADSSQLTRLTSGEQVQQLSWSADGEYLYLGDRDLKRSLPDYKLQVSTGQLSPVADGFSSHALQYVSEVSPDRRQLLYGLPQTLYQPVGKITVSGLDEATPRTLGDGVEPQWSPDGRQIVYALNSSQTGMDIYTMAADGSHVRQVLALPDDEIMPSWSPDGQTIVFGSFKRDQFGGVRDGTLYRVGLDGTGLAQLGPVSEPFLIKALPNGQAVYTYGPGNACLTPMTGGDAACITAAESTLSPDGKRAVMIRQDLFSPLANPTNVRLCLETISGAAFSDGPCVPTHTQTDLVYLSWRPGS